MENCEDISSILDDILEKDPKLSDAAIHFDSDFVHNPNTVVILDEVLNEENKENIPPPILLRPPVSLACQFFRFHASV